MLNELSLLKISYGIEPNAKKTEWRNSHSNAELSNSTEIKYYRVKLSTKAEKKLKLETQLGGIKKLELNKLKKIIN
jgi:hypothetical protein